MNLSMGFSFPVRSALVTAVYFICVLRTVAIQQYRGESFT